MQDFSRCHQAFEGYDYNLRVFSTFFAGVVIGMEETSVFVDEDVGERELCASVMSGTLGKEVMVMVVYEDRNAIGMYSKQLWSLETKTVHSKFINLHLRNFLYKNVQIQQPQFLKALVKFRQRALISILKHPCRYNDAICFLVWHSS